MKKVAYSLVCVVLLVALGSCLVGCRLGGDYDNSTSEDVAIPPRSLLGLYDRGGFVKVGAASAWAALGAAEYKLDGTGTLSHAHSEFGDLLGTTMSYNLDAIGTLRETTIVPGTAGQVTTGAVTSDKKVMVVLQNGEGASAGMRGMEVGIRLVSDSEKVEPAGEYFQVGYYDLTVGSGPRALHSVGTFNGDGAGVRTYESTDQVGTSTHPFSYLVRDGGRLTFMYPRPGIATLTILGAITSDRSVLGFVDNDPAGEVGIEIGIRKSSGKSVSSLKGRYHFFALSSAGGTAVRTAVIDFDGAGNATITGFINHDVGPFSYTVSEDGALLLSANGMSWKGGLREDNSMFAIASVEASHASLVIGMAEWK